MTHSPRCRVLLVEDHVLVAQAIMWMLKDAGFSVELVGSVEAAMEHANGQHVLLSDFHLPDGTGLDLLQQLGDRRPPRAVLMSAFSDRQLESQALQAGFDACLDKKDFTPETFLRAVGNPVRLNGVPAPEPAIEDDLDP